VFAGRERKRESGVFLRRVRWRRRGCNLARAANADN
jgi:hypothetical protein